MGHHFGMDFAIIGPEKCGTGWIDTALRQADSHALPLTLKETFYFDRHFHLGPEWHAKLFKTGDGVRGEVSPSYFASSDALKRLKATSPACRIVAVLRDPYARMASHIVHLARRGAVQLERSISAIPEKILIEARHSSHYAALGQAWREVYSDEQILFVTYDDIQKNPAALINRICSHIGIRHTIREDTALTLSKTIVFEARAPRNRLLTRVAYLSSRKMQAFGFTSFVTAMRNSKLRNIFEKPIGEGTSFRTELKDHIQRTENFESDIDFAEQVLARPLKEWRNDRHNKNSLPK